MPRFSLIVPTKDRTEEFASLLRSLAAQQMRDFELIVADQNHDDRLAPLLSSWAAKMSEQNSEHGGCVTLKHLRCPSGASRARNAALLHSTGEILAFPDDDCWYLPDTLKNIDRWFRHNEGYGILCVGSRDEQGRVSANRWSDKECDLNRLNVFRTSVTYAYFLRRGQVPLTLCFDELMGPGSQSNYGAGEDTDFLLNLMAKGVRGRFYPELYVGHPSKPYSSVERAMRYGGSWGRTLAKHSLPILCLGFTSFDFARAGLHTLRGNRGRASVLWAHGKGVLGAYFSN